MPVLALLGRYDTVAVRPLIYLVVDGQRLAQQLGSHGGAHNDLEANAYGAAALAPEDFAILNEGASEAKAMLRSSPCTGLGEAVSTGTVTALAVCL